MSCRAFSIGLALITFGAFPAFGYPVGPPDGLTKMTERADLICKARVVSSQTITNAAFLQIAGYKATATTLEIISVLKGDSNATGVVFQHYAPTHGDVWMYSPQSYELEVGQSFLIFAVKTEKEGVFRHIRQAHTMKNDEGAIRTLDARPLKGLPVKEAHWTELNLLLTNSAATNALYAIRQLDLMSRASEEWEQTISRTDDFKRADVLAALQPLLFHTNDDVAVAALRCFRSGAGATNLISTHAGSLIRLGDSGSTLPRRLAVMNALSGAKLTTVSNAVSRWLTDSNAPVRAQAVVLLADFPGTVTEQVLRKAAADESEGVRAAVAWVIGENKVASLVPTLETLLADPTSGKQPLTAVDEEQSRKRGYRENRNGAVRTSALYALLKFDTPTVGRLIRANLADDYFKPALLMKLAATDPEVWLPHLADVLERRMNPTNWEAGRSPHSDCWRCLHEHLQSLPAKRFADGRLDRYLLALEKADHGGSYEPEHIYKLYRQKGLTTRAAQYRKHCEETLKYNIGYFFDLPRP